MQKQLGWSKEQVAAMLREESFGYQKVALPYGLETGGDDRTPTAEHIFAEDMTGKSVFDLGCLNGFFCFYAEDRGADRMLGVDVEPELVRKSRLLAAIRNSRAEFDCMNIEVDPMPGTFDTVLCLNVLHHTRNPLSVLDKLI